MNSKSFAFVIISLIFLVAAISYAYVYFSRKGIISTPQEVLEIKTTKPELNSQEKKISEGRAEPVITPEQKVLFDQVKSVAAQGESTDKILKDAMAAVKASPTNKSNTVNSSSSQKTVSNEELRRMMEAVKN